MTNSPVSMIRFTNSAIKATVIVSRQGRVERIFYEQKPGSAYKTLSFSDLDAGVIEHHVTFSDKYLLHHFNNIIGDIRDTSEAELLRRFADYEKSRFGNKLKVKVQIHSL